MIEAEIYIKGKDVELSEFLRTKEVECHCRWEHCFYTLITRRTIESFTETRKEFGKAIAVNSAYRCQQRNKVVEGSASKSNHTAGDAMDLAPHFGLPGELDRLEEIAKKHFKKVLRYPSFIHCDNRLNKES